MKVFVAVALFAFVAVQLSHAAPAPDEEKKVEAPVPKAGAVDAAAPAPAAPAVDAKPAAPAADAAAPAAPAEAAKPAEEKKA